MKWNQTTAPKVLVQELYQGACSPPPTMASTEGGPGWSGLGGSYIDMWKLSVLPGPFSPRPSAKKLRAYNELGHSANIY